MKISVSSALGVLLSLVVLCPFGAGSAGAAVRAIVVGVDRYEHLPVLRGAVADARDLHDALVRAGAEVVLLLDQDATRANIMAAWDAFVAESQDGDVIVLSFAGHGIQVPDLDGDEEDGYDEAFVLPAFRPGVSDDANLIIDDEIDEMMRIVAPLPVVLIADACHSGTFLRTADPRANPGAVRFVPRSAYDGRDPGPKSRVLVVPPPPADNLVFFGAVPEQFVVAEVLIEGAPRGALSYAVARAVEGEADRDGDGWVTADELSAHVPERVRALTQNRQTPEVWAAEDLIDHRLLPNAAGALAALPVSVAAPLSGEAQTDAGSSAGGAWASAGPPSHVPETVGASADSWAAPSALGGAGATLTLAVDGPDAASGWRVAHALEGVEVLASPARADLIWHLPSGDVLTSLGDVAARLGPARDPRLLQGVVTKWRLLRALDRRIDGSLQARVLPDDRVFVRDETLAIEILSRVDGRLAVFDLASDGSLIRILPRPGHEPPRIAAGETLRVPLRAGPPFGADHVVAAVVPDARAVEAFLRTHHGRPIPPHAVGALLEALESGAVLASAIHTAPAAITPDRR